jgi:hypothetical protein
MRRAIPTVHAVVLTLLSATPAFGQSTGATAGHGTKPSGGDEASAQKLFDEGRALMQEGKIAEACPKFAASEQLASSGGTLLNLADCYEKNGQLASAWAKFHDVASRAQRAGRTDVEAMANNRIKQIEPKLSYLTIIVPQARVEGLEVRRDGEIAPKAAWDTALPIDGGDHTIEAMAPGKQTRVISVHIAPSGDRSTVTLEPLESAPVGAPTASASKDQASDAKGDARGWAPQQSLGLIAAGAGIVAVGVGVVFGLQAISKNKDAEAFCPASPQCNDPQGVSLTNDAKSAATVSTVGFVAGALLVAGGVTVYLTAPSSSPRKAALRPRLTVKLAPLGLGPALGGAW